MAERGRVELPSAYSDEPDVVTRRLIEDGRERLVLRAPLRCPFRCGCCTGPRTRTCRWTWRCACSRMPESPDMRLTLVKGEGHRFSTPERLAQIVAAVEEVSWASAQDEVGGEHGEAEGGGADRGHVDRDEPAQPGADLRRRQAGAADAVALADAVGEAARPPATRAKPRMARTTMAALPGIAGSVTGGPAGLQGGAGRG
jgi:hypothetical protein